MKTIHVTASREYDVVIGAGLLDECGQRIAAAVPGAEKAVVYTDTTVFPLYAKRVTESLKALYEDGTVKDLCDKYSSYGLSFDNWVLK